MFNPKQEAATLGAARSFYDVKGTRILPDGRYLVAAEVWEAFVKGVADYDSLPLSLIGLRTAIRILLEDGVPYHHKGDYTVSGAAWRYFHDEMRIQIDRLRHVLGDVPEI